MASEPAGPNTATVKRLFAHSGNQCAFPKCSARIVDGETVVGEICHIKAVSPKGPRYDAKQPATERHGFDNLILLCANHHTVVDADEEAYTIERLTKMKRDHEGRTGTIDDQASDSGAQLLLSVNQSGGIAAHTIHAHTINLHQPAQQVAPPTNVVPDVAGMKFFTPGEILASPGIPGEQEYIFGGERAFYLRLFAHGTQPRVGLAKLQDVFRAQKPCPLSRIIGGVVSRNAHGFIIIDPVSSSVIGAFTQGFESGELWGMNNQYFQPHPWQSLLGRQQQIITVMPMVSVEQVCLRTLLNYVRVASQEFKFVPPFTVELGAYGLAGCYLGVPGGGDFNNGQIVGPIMRDAFRRTYALDELSDGAVRGLLKGYFEDFYDLAACSRSDVWTDELARTHDVPPR